MWSMIWSETCCMVILQEPTGDAWATVGILPSQEILERTTRSDPEVR